MAGTGSQPINTIILPYTTKWREYPAPMDDWGYYEGMPTPALSPLMPYNTVPWWYRRWMFDKVKEPRYSFAQLEGQSDRLSLPEYHKIISKQIINQPSPIRDYHLIAIRRQIEQLFAPLFRAHVIVHVSDTMNFPPWFMIRHNWWQRSIWIGASGGNEDGIGDREAGHTHVFLIGDATPTGSLTMRQQLSILQSVNVTGEGAPNLQKCDGSVAGILGTMTAAGDGKFIVQPRGENFRSSYGNYYVLAIEPRWTITEHWRKAFVESWTSVQQDYMSTSDSFHYINFGTWKTILTETGSSPVGYAKKYALDYGGMWENVDNITGGPTFWMPKYVGNGDYANGPVYSSVTRPERETGQGFYGGSTFVADAVSRSRIGFMEYRDVAGFNCGIFSGTIAEQEPDETPDFPNQIVRSFAENRVIYSYSPTNPDNFPSRSGFKDITYEATGEEITIDATERRRSVTGGQYIAHCLGATVKPYYQVTIMDFNGNRYDMQVRDVEAYYGATS